MFLPFLLWCNMTFIDTANTCPGCQARDEYIQNLVAENERLDAHAKQWGIKAQQAESESRALKNWMQQQQCFVNGVQVDYWWRYEEDAKSTINLTLQEALDWQKTQNQRIAELEAQTKAEYEERGRMQSAINLLEEEKSELKDKNRNLEAEVERLKSHLEDIRADAESDYHKDGKRIAELEEALDRQDLVAADAWNENEKLEAENKRLQDNLYTVQKALALTRLYR